MLEPKPPAFSRYLTSVFICHLIVLGVIVIFMMSSNGNYGYSEVFHERVSFRSRNILF